jgi:hypothetical protein
MAANWLNSDGLYLKYGTSKAATSAGGEFSNRGLLREISFTLDLTTLTAGSAIICDAAFAPKVRWQEVEIITQTAATGATATLNLSLVKTDRTTAIGNLVTGAAIATFATVGTKLVINAGGTGAGALLGTTTTDVGYFAADFDTTAFTAGVLKITVRYYTP